MTTFWAVGDLKVRGAALGVRVRHLPQRTSKQVSPLEADRLEQAVTQVASRLTPRGRSISS
jgi:hypothetical protein